MLQVDCKIFVCAFHDCMVAIISVHSKHVAVDGKEGRCPLLAHFVQFSPPELLTWIFTIRFCDPKVMVRAALAPPGHFLQLRAWSMIEFLNS